MDGVVFTQNMDGNNRPKVGVGVIIIRDKKVLLGKRKGSHGENTWNFPGGHLEYGEDVFTCAHREVLEETGLVLANLSIGPYTNDVFVQEHKHYITLFVVAQSNSGEAQLLEPHKCEKWDWFSWDQLPTPLFLPIQNLMKTGYIPPTGLSVTDSLQ